MNEIDLKLRKAAEGILMLNYGKEYKRMDAELKPDLETTRLLLESLSDNDLLRLIREIKEYCDLETAHNQCMYCEKPLAPGEAIILCKECTQ